MQELWFRDVRCFRGEHSIRLAPLTVLIGENSAGKSTILSLIRLASDVIQGRTPNFNDDPFQLGAYEQIAHYHGGQGKRAASFGIGVSFDRDGLLDLAPDIPRTKLLPQQLTYRAEFSSRAGQPVLSEWTVRTPDAEWSVVRASEAETRVRIRQGDIVRRRDITGSQAPLLHLLLLVAYGAGQPQGVAEPDLLSPDQSLSLVRFAELLSAISFAASERRVDACAPIRTQPRRTYDPIQTAPVPTGDHVPTLLATMSATKDRKLDPLLRALADFGRDAGLFQEVEVRRHGGRRASIGDPFQLLVAVDSHPFNLVDVGYGVSQVLPIAVDLLLREPRSRTVLLQQPEVHLHPRAQAALGSFLATAARTPRQRIVVETHSDYLIDRVMMEVRDRPEAVVKHSDVSMVYLERRDGRVQIHPMSVTRAGAVVGAPEGYRSFFLDEHARALGVP